VVAVFAGIQDLPTEITEKTESHGGPQLHANIVIVPMALAFALHQEPYHGTVSSEWWQMRRGYIHM